MYIIYAIFLLEFKFNFHNMFYCTSCYKGEGLSIINKE